MTMNPTAVALRVGWRRGLIELRQAFTNGQELFGQLLPPFALLVMLLFMRHITIGSSHIALGTLALPGALGMNLVLTGLLTMALLLTREADDGTLLRAKATPNGMLGYLVGKLVSTAGGQLAGLALVLIPGSFIISGLALGSVGAWLTLLWVVVLGMLASLPIGAVLGMVFNSPRSMGLVSLPILGLAAISGLFYPISDLPGWLQTIAQVFPIYWIGLGMRSALLPGDAVHFELGESWRHLDTVGVLSLWAVLGLVLAPVVLRRMARRESGSTMVARRGRAVRRVG